MSVRLEDDSLRLQDLRHGGLDVISHECSSLWSVSGWMNAPAQRPDDVQLCSSEDPPVVETQPVALDGVTRGRRFQGHRGSDVRMEAVVDASVSEWPRLWCQTAVALAELRSLEASEVVLCELLRLVVRGYFALRGLEAGLDRNDVRRLREVRPKEGRQVTLQRLKTLLGGRPILALRRGFESRQPFLNRGLPLWKRSRGIVSFSLGLLRLGRPPNRVFR